MFKKVYIEITNVCNLNCSFCPKTSRVSEFMTLKNFKIILSKIKPYTKYIYLHVMGEPLLHKDINAFIYYAKQEGFFVNLTTNARLLDHLTEIPRQINISLQSYNGEEQLLPSLFKKCGKLREKGVYINYRLWIKNDMIKKQLEDYYDITLKAKNHKIGENLFYSREDAFNWPTPNLNQKGRDYSTLSCRALKDHIAILVDGTVVPCCLDNEGLIPLGNIYNASIKDIMDNPTYQCMLQGFKNNQKWHPLCQKCNFYQMRKK